MPQFSRRALLASVLFVGLAGPVEAQWSSLGDMPAPVRSGNTVTFKNAQGIVAVTAVSPEIVRVRFSPAAALGRDHSYAVVSKDFGDPRATIASAPGSTSIVTPALRVAIRHKPFRVEVSTAAGEALDADDAAMGTAFSGTVT